MSNFNVDHLTDADSREIPDDPSTDPSGVRRRAERPHVNNAYVQDMMVYNEAYNRWEPSQVAIQRIALTAADLSKRFISNAKPLSEEEQERVEAFLEQMRTRLPTPAFNGFLYGFKDSILKQICSSLLWMEYTEEIRAQKVLQGSDPEEIDRSETAIEANSTSIHFLSLLVHELTKEHENISLTEGAWYNAARGACWDFFGYQARSVQRPETSDSRAKRRSAHELVGLGRE